MFNFSRIIFKHQESLPHQEAASKSHFHDLPNDPLKQIDDIVNQAKAGAKRLEALNTPQTRLKALRESGLLPEDKKWSATANAEAFYKFAESLWENTATRELFQLEELHIVYPGAGVHLSPLEMGIQMAEKGGMEKIVFTYTEINPEHYRNIDEMIATFVNNNPHLSLLNIQKLEPAQQEDWDSPRLKTISFQLITAEGRKVNFEVHFEYKIAGKRWVREAVSKKADLWILHDADSTKENTTKAQNSADLIINDFYAPLTGDKKVFAIAPNSKDELHPERTYSRFGEVVATQEGYHIGCGENHWNQPEHYFRELDTEQKTITKSASIIKIDTKKLTEMRQLGGGLALRGYAYLIQYKNLEVILNPQIVQSLYKVYEGTKSASLKKELSVMLKNALEMAASHILHPMFNVPKVEDSSLKLLLEISGLTPKDLKRAFDQQKNTTGELNIL